MTNKQDRYSSDEAIIERIKQRLKELRIRPIDINKRLDRSKGWIYNYLRHQRQFDRETLELIATALETGADWLQYGEYPTNDQQKLTSRLIANLQGKGRIPAWKYSLTWQEATRWNNITEIEMQSISRKKIPFDESHHPDCFSLPIVKDSMMPRFNLGDYIIVDPYIKPKFGNFTVLQLISSDEVIFAQYFEQTDRVILKFLNNKYPNISTENSNIKVIGVVKERIAIEIIE